MGNIGSAAGLFALVYLALLVIVVGLTVTALWRGMRAQERMEQHLAQIAQTLSARANGGAAV
jgi:Flp pilus assembly protein TadG